MWPITGNLVLVAALSLGQSPGAGNRLTYLDDFCNPYYAGLQTPKLVTQQWVGEEGVEAAIVLAIDDMRNTARYEAFLRPILDRLKRIDGRAPVSIMTNNVNPQDPQLAAWLKEGLSIETHTIDHPCPCLQGGGESDLAKAKDTYDRCVDLLVSVPGSRPVAFRMPCCDSMNAVSPRFFTEVFFKTTPAGNFLTLDTSVFHLSTAADPALPRELVLDADGGDRFRKYVPTDRGMVNLVENYPYPYVIGRLVWQFPCLMPSDWDGQHLNGKCSPKTLSDYKAAVDAAVIKQGVFSLCFHPHGWITAEQVAELVDYADRTYGGKVKFLTFAEVQRRLDENLLAGQPLRDARGRDNGVRLLDLDHDGYMDVVVGNSNVRQTRLWQPENGTWRTVDFPVEIVSAVSDHQPADAGARFGILQANGNASVLVLNERTKGLWHWNGNGWRVDPAGLKGLDGGLLATSAGRDRGLRLIDLDLDGTCELIVANLQQNAAFRWSAAEKNWQRLPFSLPQAAPLVDRQGRDAGLRLVDLDEDGFADVVFSNADRYAVYLFASMDDGWSRCVRSGSRGDRNAILPIVRGDGTNNGAWFNDRQMWVQNEQTGNVLHAHADGRPFSELLGIKPQPTPAR